jgi:Fe2+ transport system protein FeoA
MSEPKPEKKVRNTRKKTVRDTISRQRVEQIQRSGMGEIRRRLYEMGITCMADIK